MSIHFFQREEVVYDSLIPAFQHYAHKSLKDLSSKPETNFNEVIAGSKKNVFHLIAQEPGTYRYGVGRLNSIVQGVKDGLSQGNRNPTLAQAINDRDDDGITPLFRAVQAERHAIVEKLLDLGANPETECKSRKPEQLEIKNPHIRELLKEARHKNICECLKDGAFEKAHQLLDKGESADKLDASGNNLMLLSIKYVKNENEVLKLLRRLHEKHVDVNRMNNSGESVILLAVRNGYNDVLRFLLLETQVNLSVKYKHFNDNTILHEAAQTHDMELLKLVIQYTKDLVNTMNRLNKTPVCLISNPAAIDIFFQNEADMEIPLGEKNGHIFTPLDHLILLGNAFAKSAVERSSISTADRAALVDKSAKETARAYNERIRYGYITPSEPKTEKSEESGFVTALKSVATTAGPAIATAAATAITKAAMEAATGGNKK